MRLYNKIISEMLQIASCRMRTGTADTARAGFFSFFNQKCRIGEIPNAALFFPLPTKAFPPWVLFFLRFFFFLFFPVPAHTFCITKNMERRPAARRGAVRKGRSHGLRRAIFVRSDGNIMCSETGIPEPGIDNQQTDGQASQQHATYRTKGRAVSVVHTLPEKLAIITSGKYVNAMNLRQTEVSAAYLLPVVSMDGLEYDTKTNVMKFRGLPGSEATLREINKGKEPPSIEKVDLPLLRLFYAIILGVFEQRERKFTTQEIRIYLPDLARLLGKSHSLNRAEIGELVSKAMQFQTIYGIIKDPEYPHRMGSALPLLLWMGYDSKDNTISFASPYLTTLIERVYGVPRLPTGHPRAVQDTGTARGAPPAPKLPALTNSYLVKSTIVKEKNKRAVEVVIAVVTIIEKSGPYGSPHVKAAKLINMIPQLQRSLAALQTTKNRNQLLKRTFTKAWELLNTQTTLKEKYRNIQLPDPSDSASIPTVQTMDRMVLSFPHHGIISEK